MHVSLLDLFYVSHSGPVFLWEKNSQTMVFIVHALIAFLTLFTYLLVSKIRVEYQSGRYVIQDKVWLICSVGLVFLIGIMMI
jgi:hypothetical protein